MIIKKNVINYLFSFLKNKEIRNNLSLALLLLFIAKALTISLPFLFGIFIDKLNTNHKPNIIIFALILLYGFIRFFSFLFDHIKDVIFTSASEKITKIAAVECFRHIINLDHKFFLSHSPGIIARKLNRGIDAISSLAIALFLTSLPLLLEIIFVFIILFFSLDYIFSLTFLVTVVIYIVLTLKITEKRFSIIRNLNYSDDQINNHLHESLINFENIKYFNTLDSEALKYKILWDNQESLTIKSTKALAKLKIIQDMLISISLMIFIAIATYFFLANQISIGDITMIIAYFTQLIAPISSFAGNHNMFKNALIDMEGIVELKKQESSIKEHNAPQEINNLEHNIKFKNVSFGYNQAKPILNNVNLEIEANKTIAIVGQSGSGKTTITKLLTRFYDPSEGEILIDNRDIKELKLQNLRKLIAVIPQNIDLFNNTLRYNITYGLDDISEDKLIEAIKASNLYDFVMSLPNRLEENIGERGLSLSGGEKQRLAIARALIRDPKVIILDEATSSLDLINEEEIMETINRLNHKVTIVFIAHRLQAASKADKIYVMNEGRIIESGLHHELIEKNGIYKRMWDIIYPNYRGSNQF